jgi:drug/metabolite transporter (DMT)-like permease
MPPPSTGTSSASDNARGIAAMLVAVAAFVVGDTIIKFAGQRLPVGEMIFVRGLFASAIIVASCWAAGLLGGVGQVLTLPVAVRTICDVGATIFFFSALVRMPFASVNAINQFAPLAVTAGAALFLREPVGWRRWSATTVGFLGVLVIIRPGTEAFDPAGLLVIASVCCVVVRDLLTRRIALAVPTLLIAGLSGVSVSLSGLLLLPFENWRIPSLQETFLLAGAALCIFVGYYAIVHAMRLGELAVVAPFRYAGTVFAVVTGYAVFSEIPDGPTLLGILIVVAAGLYSFHRERVRRRRK